MTCNRTDDVQRFHDDELSSAERDVMESHLRDCDECRAMLLHLRRLSQLISRAPLADMPAEAADRVRESWHAVRDRGVVQAAGWLTAVAATVLIGALLTWPAREAEPGPPLWQTAAVTPPAGAHDDGRPETVVTAQWMADDLGSGEKR